MTERFDDRAEELAYKLDPMIHEMGRLVRIAQAVQESS